GQTRPPTWSSGSWDRTAATRIGRSTGKPSSRSARALAAWSLSALMANSTRAGWAMGVWGGAGPPRARGGGGAQPVQQKLVQRARRAGAFQPHRADLLLIQGDRH